MRDSLPPSRTLLVIAGLLLAGVVAQSAAAQTSGAKVEDDGSNVVLQTFFEGQLLAPGPFGSGTIPATGSGTRMMWWPKEAAFRAGRVGVASGKSDVWDASSVGEYSVAFGEDTKANNSHAVAMGETTTASGRGAMAIGGKTTASGSQATAMGVGTTASALQTTAMGVSTTASGDHATAMGNSTTAATNNSLSIGEYNSANTSADNTLFVVGNGSSSSRSDALVLDGSGNLEVTGSFVLPDGTTVDGSEDLGLSTNSNGASEVDNNDGFVATGTFDSGSIPTSGAGTRMMWYPNKAAFRAGRVGVNKAGTRWDASDVGDHSVAFGVDTKASDAGTVAMGEGSTAGNGDSFGGEHALAIGFEAKATNGKAVAFGYKTTASGPYATAMSFETTASEYASTAMGNRTTASGDDATAMGNRTTADTPQSFSIGQCNDNNTSSDNTLFVVGNGGSPSGGCNSRSDALVLDESGNISIDGVFEAGPTNSNHAGHFQATKSGTDTDKTVYPVRIENTSTNSNADGLLIEAGPTSNPTSNNNYISFFDGDGDAIGNVEGNGSGGVRFESGAADYAEELPVAAGVPTPEPADLVGVRSGDVTLNTAGADRVMIASTAPIMTANTTPSTEADDARRVAVAFVGQVPARVRGSVEVGDLIVPSGKDDGTARAVSPGEYRRSTHGPIAGQAWSAKTAEEIGKVTVAVGLGRNGAVAKRLQAQQAQIEQKNEQIADLRANQKKIQKRLAALEAGRSPSVVAGLSNASASLLLPFLLGGLLGAGLLHLRRPPNAE